MYYFVINGNQVHLEGDCKTKGQLDKIITHFIENCNIVDLEIKVRHKAEVEIEPPTTDTLTVGDTRCITFSDFYPKDSCFWT